MWFTSIWNYALPVLILGFILYIIFEITFFKFLKSFPKNDSSEFINFNIRSAIKNVNGKKIIEFIKLNYKSIDLKISDIATYLHITPQYMSKIFKEERGESVVSYLISYRMNVARELLLSGRTVSEASLESGYLDLSNFSKTYKRVFGFPPSETNVKYY
jgi:AraC-like DNA-binding protein